MREREVSATCSCGVIWVTPDSGSTSRGCEGAAVSGRSPTKSLRAPSSAIRGCRPSGVGPAPRGTARPVPGPGPYARSGSGRWWCRALGALVAALHERRRPRRRPVDPADPGEARIALAGPGAHHGPGDRQFAGRAGARLRQEQTTGQGEGGQLHGGVRRVAHHAQGALACALPARTRSGTAPPSHRPAAHAGRPRRTRTVRPRRASTATGAGRCRNTSAGRRRGRRPGRRRSRVARQG